MSQLNALLISSIEYSLPINLYFPSNYQDKSSINDLLIISNHFKNCGKGIIQHNNKLFYYRTYIPNYSGEQESESHSNSFSDYINITLDCSKNQFFLLFYCDLNYSQKYLDKLTNEIFEILDNGAFDVNQLKNNCKEQINNLFKRYQRLSPKFIENNLLENIEESENEEQLELNIENKKKHKKRRFDNRVIETKIPKTKAFGEVSVDIDDITSIKDSMTHTSSSMMFKQNIIDYENTYINKEVKKIQTINLISFFLLFIVMIIILVLI
jgi:hypothetical protein